MATYNQWLSQSKLMISDARKVTTSDDPKTILLTLNESLMRLNPQRIATASKETTEIKLSKSKVVSFPRWYDLKCLITENKDGRKSIWRPNGQRIIVCLTKDCIKTVQKYNHCSECRDQDYEKAFKPKVKEGNRNTILMELNGKHYSGTFFRVSKGRWDIIGTRIWYLNPRNEVTCADGKLIDLLMGDGWKARQKVKNLEYTSDNLEFSRQSPYIPDGKLTFRIPLSGDKGFGKEAKIDQKLVEFIKKYSWNFASGGYARSKAGLMHRLVMSVVYGENAIEGMVVDHIDGDRLNNCVDNLRIITSKGNAKNRTTNPESGFEGVVCLSPEMNACIIKGIEVYKDPNPKVCALVYDSVVTYIYGPGKRLNDNISEEPVALDKWNLSEEVLEELKKLKEKHTDYHGVRYTKDGWKSKITIELGNYPSQEEAARAYDIVALLIKSGVPLNFKAEKYSGKHFSFMMRKLFEQ